MILSHQYLVERHAFWLGRIARAGIWQPDLFKPVNIALRPRSKTCHGKFQRKPVTMNGQTRLTDFIIIYQQHPDITARQIDDTLVHEMIHQYIFQARLKDSGPHGPLFRKFMARINAAFPGELSISVRGAIQRSKGAGARRHLLLILRHTDGYYICCKINPAKEAYFTDFLRLTGPAIKIAGYELCESDDRYFDFLTTCNTRLRGERLTASQLDALRRDCRLVCR